MNRIKNTEYKRCKPKMKAWKKKRINNLRRKGTTNSENAASSSTDTASANKTQSTSQANLSEFQDDWQVEDLNDNQESSDYILIHKNQLSRLYEDLACPVCGMKSVRTLTSNFYGFAFTISVLCDSCSEVIKEVNSSTRTTGSSSVYHVNKKIVEAMILMGEDYDGLQKFCMAMNMNIMSRKTFNEILLNLRDESSRIKEEVLEIKEEYCYEEDEFKQEFNHNGV